MLYTTYGAECENLANNLVTFNIGYGNTNSVTITGLYRSDIVEKDSNANIEYNPNGIALANVTTETNEVTKFLTFYGEGADDLALAAAQKTIGDEMKYCTHSIEMYTIFNPLTRSTRRFSRMISAGHTIKTYGQDAQGNEDSVLTKTVLLYGTISRIPTSEFGQRLVFLTPYGFVDPNNQKYHQVLFVIDNDQVIVFEKPSDEINNVSKIEVEGKQYDWSATPWKYITLGLGDLGSGMYTMTTDYTSEVATQAFKSAIAAVNLINNKAVIL